MKEWVDFKLYATLLRKCSSSKLLLEGRRLHSELRDGGFDRHLFIGNLLVQMYGNCGKIDDARSVYEKLLKRNVYSWNIMMAACTQNGHLQGSRNMFDRMPEWNIVSWNSILAAYAQRGLLANAKATFDGMPEQDVVSWNALISAYIGAGNVEGAAEAFERMEVRDIISWASMITAFAQSRDLVKAKEVFDNMPAHTLVAETSMITAYSQNGQLEEAKVLFKKMTADAVSCTAMIVAYAQKGHMQEAQILFNGMPRKDIVAWTTMIGAFVQNGQGSNALELFRKMDIEGVHPSNVTFVTALDSCSCPDVSALREGKILHSIILDAEIESHVIVSTALINMYGKCGKIQAARVLFDKLRHSDDVIVWNAMMAVHANHGQILSCLEVFHDMVHFGVSPDDISFLTILCMCGHGGLTSMGRQYFLQIRGDYDHFASEDHYVCLVDLLGRAGRLEDAEELIRCMPYQPQAVVWKMLLGACRDHGESQLGAQALDSIFNMDESDDPSPYVLWAHTKGVAHSW